jgi:hypothetical protein
VVAPRPSLWHQALFNLYLGFQFTDLSIKIVGDWPTLEIAPQTDEVLEPLLGGQVWLLLFGYQGTDVLRLDCPRQGFPRSRNRPLWLLFEMFSHTLK